MTLFLILCPEDAVELSRIPIALVPVVVPVFAAFIFRLEMVLLAMVVIADSTQTPITLELVPGATDVSGAAELPIVLLLMVAVTLEAVKHLIAYRNIDPVLELVAVIEVIELFEIVVVWLP